MKKFVSLIIALAVLALTLSGCGAEEPKKSSDPIDAVAGNADDELVDGALTVLICGTQGFDVETAAAIYEEKFDTKVNVIKYDSDSDWDKFSTKIMAQNSDFDLFLPVQAQLGDVIRSGIYEDLSGYEDIITRINSNSLVKMLAVVDGVAIGIPCNTQLSYSGDIETAYTLFKYCYKNIDLFTGEYADPEGEELFNMLKHQYADPSDSKDNPFYDFDFYEAMTSYLFMNRNSEKKEAAADFLCVLFDILNKDLESDAVLTYPEPVEGAEYTPSWKFYTYDYVKAIGHAWSSCVETDGSDGALKNLAEDAARAVRMRLEG